MATPRVSVSAFNAVPTESAQSQPGTTEHNVLAETVAVLLFGGLFVLLSGVLTAVIGSLVLGERRSTRQAWRIGFARLPAMIGAVI
jgi:hypothetical protein